MEHIGVQGVNPHLQRVLKSFQTTAMRSLQGPGPGIFQTLITDMAELEQYRKALAKKLPAEKGMEFDSLRAPPPFPVQQIPVLTPVDNGKSERIDTNLEEEKIACFVVGGEKRLCLPQILNTVLRDFSLQQINAVCDDLHIFCSRCNPEQLHILKITGVLPLSAPSCGLITKTDAERLCNALLHSSPEKYIEHPTKDSFKVYHECFGKCKGVFYPEIYSTPTGKCVQCCDCMGLFSPQTFVCHSHKALENRTCHWGFDSANWRSYLLLAKDQEGKEKLQEALERMKAKFDSNKNKRKQMTESSTCLKRSKSEESPGSSSSPGSWGENGEGRTMSAFRPWSPGMINAFKEGKGLPAPPAIMREGTNSIPPPYLQTGPPVLLNPERVVPHSESASYERGFAPNVSLAPPSHQKSSVCDTNEEEDEKERKTKILSSILDKQQSKEWELPSESDDSLHPSDGEECRSPEVKNLVETELDLIRRALDSTAKCSKDEKDNIIREFSKLRAQSEEYLQNTVQANRTLRQELTSQKLSTKEKVNKLCEENSKLEKEIEKIRIESECRMEKAEEDREKLMKEIKRLQTQEEAEATKYIQMNRELQARLHQFEMAYEQLYCDTIYLQEELQRHGIMLPEIISKQKFNGRYVGSKLSPRSPQLSPSGNSRSHAQSQTFCVKKERDT